MHIEILKIVRALCIISLFSIGSLIMVMGWDNFKLKTVPYWSYLTLRNNPLLKARWDADLVKASVDEDKNPRIDMSELLSGGPPKDGIPAIDNPKFDTRDSTPFKMDETILGVVINGEAKAYPYGILNWHEIVNDTIGGVPVSVTYCPLCDTGITFERVVNGMKSTFGVSGKLYQSCLVMYERLTDSLWSQPWGIGVLGEETDTILKRYPTYKTTLGKWLRRYPDSKILSAKTGYRRSYFRYPYGTYYTDNSLIFPVRNRKMVEGKIKEIFYIIWEPDGKAPFNSFSGFSQAFFIKSIKEKGVINTKLGAIKAVVLFDAGMSAVRVFEVPKEALEIRDDKIVFSDGSEKSFDKLREIPTTSSFAFVYPAFFQ